MMIIDDDDDDKVMREVLCPLHNKKSCKYSFIILESDIVI